MRTLAALGLAVACILVLRGAWKNRQRPDRLDTSWELFVHGNGRYLHFIPSGEHHTEDEEGECNCHPRMEMRRAEGRPDHYVYYHSRRKS